MDTFLHFLIAYGYIGVFFASYLAATLIPFASEVVLTGVMMAGGGYWLCILSATLGNWLGGMTNYGIGRLGKKEWVVKYLRIKEEKVDKTTAWLQGKGAFISFFVFLPGIGDVIAVGLGYLRANVWIVSLFMLLGKFFRYIAWIYIVNWVSTFF